MKKQYKAMGALAIATAFIAINGAVVDASPERMYIQTATPHMIIQQAVMKYI